MFRPAVSVLPCLLLLACGARTDVDKAPPPPDAGFDAGRPDAGRDDAGPRDAGPRFPDGATPDAAACPSDCDDGRFCNGIEFCEETTGRCEEGLPPLCDDGDECTVDGCDPDANACVHEVEDRDGDGDGVSSCSGDCNDDDGSIFPGAMEACDLVDQDCDGDVDEGARSECNDCRPGCRIVDMPEEVAWELGEDNSSGLERGPDGSLRLSSERTEIEFAWIANFVSGTVTKLDTSTGNQVAAYDSVRTGPENGAAPPGEQCETVSEGGNCPSRTAVDLRGAVYVANRAFFGQGTVTKIAGFEEDCIDRNGNGIIDTSRDRNGNGEIDRGVDGEFLGQADECILWTVDVGGDDGVPRAIAVAADGTVWVGLYKGMAVFQIDPDDGEVLREIPLGTRNFTPYGGAIASDGTLWLTEAATGRILSIDTATGDVGIPRTARGRDGCSGSYGIAVDQEDRVWITGFQCRAAFRYDPDGGRWFEVSLPDSGGTRGIAADDRGWIYVGASNEYIRLDRGGLSAGPEVARVTRFRADDGSRVRIYDLPEGLGTIGVGLDPDRRLWAVNQTSGSATRLDPDTGATREYPVGTAPYTYSDFTGFALRTFTAPNGYLRTVVEGCAVGPTEWERVTWDATTPGDTEVQVRVRAAATRAEIGSSTWLGPFRTMPAELALPPGPVPTDRFLEVEVMLVSDAGDRSPRVRSVNVQLNCPI